MNILSIQNKKSMKIFSLCVLLSIVVDYTFLESLDSKFCSENSVSFYSFKKVISDQTLQVDIC